MSTIDLSRDATDFRKRYDGVRMQQGRVLTDDDFNQAAAIEEEQLRRTTVESIGPYGSSNDGFLPKEVGAAMNKIQLRLSEGSLYLGGIRLDMPASGEMFNLQKDWLNFDPASDWPTPPLDGKPRVDLVWIEAWRQAVTAVEDRELLEVALGGPDTTARMRSLRRVRILTNVGSDVCAQAWQAAISAWASSGSLADDYEWSAGARLSVGFTAPSATGSLCSPPVAGGYLGAENQAIRVQAVSATEYTWGYDNGAPLYRALLKAGGKLKLLTPPKDAAHWPLKGQVVEILGWAAALNNGERLAEESGFLTKVTSSYDPDSQELTLAAAPPAGFASQWEGRTDKSSFYQPKLVNGEDVEHFVYLRVWNRGDDLASPPAIPLGTGPLGQTGLSVKFSGKPPRAGDHWIIAARPAAPDVVTPWSLAGAAGEPPRGPKRYRAPLALLAWSAQGTVTVYDCRPKFRPLTRQRCCLEWVAKPGPGWESVFEQIPSKGDAAICFPPGNYPTDKPILVAGKGRLRLLGAGASSRLTGPAAEIVLQFQNCDGVEMRDLHVHGGHPTTKGLGGAISFQNVRQVELSAVSVRCKAGRSRQVSCVKVENAAGTGRVSVSRCEFYVGHLQVGVMVLNAQRIHIQGNRFVASGPDVESVQHALRDPHYLTNLAQSSLVIAANPSAIPTNQRLDVPGPGGTTVSFAIDEGLKPFWTGYLNAHPGLGVTQGLAGLLRVRLMHRLKRLLGSKKARNNNAPLRVWLEAIDNSGQAVIGQAIVIGGRYAGQVSIEGNDINDAAQGIHIGLSHATTQRSAVGADVAGRVSVSQNTLHCLLCAGVPLERHGIFVGNAGSVLVADNYLSLRRLPGVRHLAVDGIKLFGHLGEFVQIRSNHISGFSRPLNLTQRGRAPQQNQRIATLNFPASANTAQ